MGGATAPHFYVLAMKKLFVSISAVPLSIARPYLKNFKRHYPEIFNRFGSGEKKDRINIPLNASRPIVDVKPNKAVEDYLHSKGYTIENYFQGTARDKYGRTPSIGKIVKDNPEIKQLFDSDPNRKAANAKKSNFTVVISRHPYDLVGMSFDRGWTSCMNLESELDYKKHIKDDINKGTLVAYLVKNDDLNINRPTARVLIKPFYSSSGERLMVLDKTYGTELLDFRLTVSNFLEHFNRGKSEGVYLLDEDLYADDDFNIFYYGDIKKGIGKLSEDDLEKICIATYIREQIDYFIDTKNETIAQNKNLIKEDYINIKSFVNPYEFVYNCPFEELVFNDPAFTNSEIQGYKGPFKVMENLLRFIKAGGKINHLITKRYFKTYLKYLNWLPRTEENLNYFGVFIGNSDITLNYTNCPVLKEWVELSIKHNSANILTNLLEKEAVVDLVKGLTNNPNNKRKILLFLNRTDNKDITAKVVEIIEDWIKYDKSLPNNVRMLILNPYQRGLSFHKLYDFHKLKNDYKKKLAETINSFKTDKDVIEFFRGASDHLKDGAFKPEVLLDVVDKKYWPSLLLYGFIPDNIEILSKFLDGISKEDFKNNVTEDWFEDVLYYFKPEQYAKEFQKFGFSYMQLREFLEQK